jgi:hypothetical protein
MSYNPEEYDDVNSRINKFYTDHKDGKIHTELVKYEDGIVIFKALILIDKEMVATGHAEETIGQGYVNKTCALENCETSSIGRGLANYNYSGKKRPSREEMEKVQRSAPAKTEEEKVSEVFDGKIQTCEVIEKQIKEYLVENKGFYSTDQVKLWSGKKDKFNKNNDIQAMMQLQSDIKKIVENQKKEVF